MRSKAAGSPSCRITSKKAAESSLATSCPARGLVLNRSPKNRCAGARASTDGSSVPATKTSRYRHCVPRTRAARKRPTKLCGALTATSWIEVAGIETSAFAQNDYTNTAKTAEIAQEADTFTGGDAQRAMTAIWRVFGKCATFTQGSGDTTATYTMTRKRLPGVGDDAIEAVQTSPAYDGGTTLVAIRIGNEIVTTMDSSPDSDKGRGAVGYAERIAKNLP